MWTWPFLHTALMFFDSDIVSKFCGRWYFEIIIWALGALNAPKLINSGLSQWPVLYICTQRVTHSYLHACAYMYLYAYTHRSQNKMPGASSSAIVFQQLLHHTPVSVSPHQGSLFLGVWRMKHPTSHTAALEQLLLAARALFWRAVAMGCIQSPAP